MPAASTMAQPPSTDLGRVHAAALQLGSPALPQLLHGSATLAASTGLFFALFLPIMHGLCKEIQNHTYLFITFCYFL